MAELVELVENLPHHRDDYENPLTLLTLNKT